MNKIVDKQEALEVVKHGGYMIENVVEELWYDPDVLLTAALAGYPVAIKKAPTEMHDNKELFLRLVQKDFEFLQYASPRLQDDKDVVMAALHARKFVSAFNYHDYVSPRLRDDRDVIMEAIKISGVLYLYKSVAAELDVAIKCIEYGDDIYQVAPYEIRCNRDFVIASVKKDGWRFVDAPSNLRADREIALLAILRFSNAIKHVAGDLKKDRELAFFAVSSGCSLDSIPKELWTDKEFVVKVLHGRSYAIDRYVSPELRADREVILAAIGNTADSLQYASPELRDDSGFILTAISKTVDALNYASPRLKADGGIALVAIKKSASAYQYISDELKKDKALVLLAVRSDGSMLSFVPKPLRDDPQVVLAAKSAKNNPVADPYLDSFRDPVEVNTKAGKLVKKVKETINHVKQKKYAHKLIRKKKRVEKDSQTVKGPTK